MEIADLSFGPEHKAMLLENGNLYTWGKGKYYELGNGESVDEVEEPTKVEGISDVIQVECGKHHTLALTRDGRVYSWGWGGNFFSAGCLGHSSRDDCPEPTLVEALADVEIEQIAVGDYHCLALDTQGQAYSWGRGESGRLGNGSSGNTKVPEVLAAFEGVSVTEIASGPTFCAALDEEGMLYTWGKNDNGQVGQAPGISLDVYNMELVPTHLDAFEGARITKFACGEKHMLAVTENSDLYKWGEKQDTLVPNLVHGDEDSFAKEEPVIVGAGGSYSAVVNREGQLFTWGSGGSGCLGNAVTSNVAQPTLVRGFGEIVGRKIVDVRCGMKDIAVKVEEE